MAEQTKQSRPEILAELQAAFPREVISAAGAFEPWGATYPDAEPYRQQLDGKRWDQLDRDHLVRRSDALGFLGTRHLVAVLPVYLLAMVEEGAWSPATGMLTTILASPAPGTDTGLGHDRFRALVDALTEPQRVAIAHCLRSFADHDAEGSPGKAARAALEGHWNRYLQEEGR